QITAQVKAHPADLLPDGRGGLAADRRSEGREHRSVLPLGRSRLERVPQEVKRHLPVTAVPGAVLAVSGGPGQSPPRAPTERSVTVSRHSALTIQSGGNGGSRPSARTDRVPVG